jgi:elongation factor G
MIGNLDRQFHRETVQGSGVGEGKIIRQRGNIGVYAHARIAVSSMGRGQGVQVAWEAGDSIPSRFASAVIEGVRDVLNVGILSGMQMTDVRISVEDGSYHEIDSTPEGFREAAREGTTQAMRQAQPVILEAVAAITAIIPLEFLASVEERIIAFGGRVTKRESGDSISVVEARIPAPPGFDLVATILADTNGRSTISLVITGFEIKPEPPGTVEQWVPVI